MSQAPREFCPFHKVEIKPIDRGSFYFYKCPANGCSTEIKNYKPLSLKPGEKKNFAPER